MVVYTGEQNERRRRVAEVLDSEPDAVRLGRRHHASAVTMAPPDVRNEWAVGYIGEPPGSRRGPVVQGPVAQERLPGGRWLSGGGQVAERKLIGPCPQAEPLTVLVLARDDKIGRMPEADRLGDGRTSAQSKRSDMPR